MISCPELVAAKSPVVSDHPPRLECRSRVSDRVVSKKTNELKSVIPIVEAMDVPEYKRLLVTVGAVLFVLVRSRPLGRIERRCRILRAILELL